MLYGGVPQAGSRRRRGSSSMRECASGTGASWSTGRSLRRPCALPRPLTRDVGNLLLQVSNLLVLVNACQSSAMAGVWHSLQ